MIIENGRDKGLCLLPLVRAATMPIRLRAIGLGRVDARNSRVGHLAPHEVEITGTIEDRESEVNNILNEWGEKIRLLNPTH